MGDVKDNGEHEPIRVLQWAPGHIKALYEEALRATREIEPDAKRPLNAIFSGMVAQAYRPAPQFVPGRVMPVQDFLGRGH